MKGIHNYYTKLFSIILISVMLSTVVISGISIVRNIESVRTLTEHNLITSGEQKVKIYELNINSLHNLAKSIGDNHEIINYFENLRAGREDKNYFGYLKTDLEDELKSYSELLENAFFVYKGLVYVDGIGGSSVDLNIEAEASEWYITAINSKKHYLGKLKKSPVTGLPVMVSAYPILDENNQILAVFGMAINLNGFSDSIINNSKRSGENTIIIDDSGTVVAANDTALIYNYKVGKELPKLYQYITEHSEGIVDYRKDGIPYLAAVIKSDFGVTIIQSLPVSSYLNPIISSVILSILLLLFIVGIVAVITSYVARNITKPIKLLVDEFNDMAMGNYENDIPDHLKKRKDEFGILGNALADMKNQTSQLIVNLNLSNEEIEASLEEVVATEEELKRQNELLSISENQLKQSNEYNKAIINVLPDVIFLLDKEGTFTDCRVSQEQMLFVPKERFLGKKLKDIMPDHIAGTGYEKIQAALETGDLQSFEYELMIDHKLEIFEMRIIKCFNDQVMAIARAITNKAIYQKQIEYLSYHDQLTGLHNRRYFEEELKRLDREHNLPLCIIMADVNGLKLVNDSFGHKAGDKLLEKFADVLRDSYPTHATISRIGGDEFVIMIPNMYREEADEMVNRIKSRCDHETVKAINLSVSFGWEVKNHISEDIGTILKSAEDFMYKKKLFEGPSMRGKTIHLIINTLHEKNKREEQHSHRVAELCEKLANALHMQDHEKKEIRSAGLLHDIGKIAIQENLLNKPGRLTPEEFEEISRHPEIGYRILCSANEMTDIAEYVLSHHERWDGKGYPRGLSGENIPLQARMIAIADTFDAMTSVRSYRDPVSDEAAAKEILKNAGTQFDPELAKKFVIGVLGFQMSL